MKKTILTLASATFVAAITLTSCNSSADKVVNAEVAVSAANKDLDEANEAYLKDVESYRKINAEKIEANDKSLEQFKKRIEKEKKEVRAEYKEKISALEEKNSDLKKKLADYKTEGKAKWEVYKSEFSEGMEQLGNSIKSLSDKAMK